MTIHTDVKTLFLAVVAAAAFIAAAFVAVAPATSAPAIDASMQQTSATPAIKIRVEVD